MKKLITIMLISILFISCIANVMALEIDYASLTDEELNELISEASSERANRYTVHIPEGVKASPDKYTWYIQDYVGRNAASFGYTSGADRLDDYGKGYIKFVFVAADGMFIDIEDEKMLQQYIVTGQNITLNTEMKYEFLKNSFGEEYSSLIAFQSIDQIDLTVRRIDGVMAGDSIVFELIPITQSPDKYTQYIRNYIGKNAASFGYASDGGRRDDYGKGSIRINFIADDGSYIDPEDIDILKKYVVIAQDIQPNTEMKLTFLKNSKGKEYSSLIDSMSYESITLYVHKLDIAYPEAFSKIEAKDDEIVEETMAITEQTAASSLVDGTVLSYGDVKYRLMSDDTVEICGYTKLQSSITIPSEIDGHIVNRIADGAFEKNTKLKNLLNWADLTYIGSSAFKGCTELSQISIPSSATYIGESAFEDCTSLKTVFIWGDPTSIEKNTFKNCTKLSQISIPSSATYIGESAFENCVNMSSVLIWGDITNIGKKAFKNCNSLDSISIPSSCKVIEESAFEACTDMDDILLWGDTNIGNSAFRGCTSLEEISIPSGTEYIGDYAFEGCSNLENVILWGNSTKIGKDAFANCPKLKSVPR